MRTVETRLREKDNRSGPGRKRALEQQRAGLSQKLPDAENGNNES